MTSPAHTSGSCYKASRSDQDRLEWIQGNQFFHTIVERDAALVTIYVQVVSALRAGHVARSSDSAWIRADVDVIGSVIARVIVAVHLNGNVTHVPGLISGGDRIPLTIRDRAFLSASRHPFEPRKRKELDRSLVHVELLKAEHVALRPRSLQVASLPSTGLITTTVAFPFRCTATITGAITIPITSTIMATHHRLLWSATPARSRSRSRARRAPRGSRSAWSRRGCRRHANIRGSCRAGCPSESP